MLATLVLCKLSGSLSARQLKTNNLSFLQEVFADIIFRSFSIQKNEMDGKSLDGKDISFQFHVKITLFHKSLIRSFVYFASQLFGLEKGWTLE